MQERPLDQQEKESSRGVNTEFHADKSERRCELDVVRRTKLLDRVNDEFLYQVCAVSDTGDKRCARNLYPSKNQPRTLRADKEPSHAERDERELPDAGADANVAGDSSSSSSANYLARILSISHEMQKSHDIDVVALAESNRSFATSCPHACS